MLTRLQLTGFRSIHSMDLEFRPLNILVGAHGSGKSNLVAFFNLLQKMMAGRLQEHVAQCGSAGSLLYGGPGVTAQAEFRLGLSEDGKVGEYRARFSLAPGDTLVIAYEAMAVERAGFLKEVVDMGAGHLEAALLANSSSQAGFYGLLSRCCVYDLQDFALSRQANCVSDNWPLRSEGQNLAAFLHYLRERHFAYYARILSTIQLVVPFLDDFVLDPQAGEVTLNWREKGSEQLMAPHQLSDGTLRVIALVALLLQPEEMLPKMIIVDGPELGLCPSALEVVASLFDRASAHTQVLLSTQSSAFLDHFDVETVVVVERSEDGSRFHRLDPSRLEAWLERYSLGELWEKNLLGSGV